MFSRPRDQDQERLEQTRVALEQMLVAEEEDQQNQVEESLRRTEKMLQVRGVFFGRARHSQDGLLESHLRRRCICAPFC